MIVVDTNVLSEAMKPSDLRSPRAFAWWKGQSVGALFTTTITLAEVLAGIAILPAGKRRDQMQEAAEKIFATVFAQRILPFDEQAARIYAGMITVRRKAGRSSDPFDIQIAAIAKAHGMAVATRNVPDFEDVGVNVIDPWIHGNPC
jgi:predicted nucleic acid-binding protein